MQQQDLLEQLDQLDQQDLRDLRDLQDLHCGSRVYWDPLPPKSLQLCYCWQSRSTDAGRESTQAGCESGCRVSLLAAAEGILELRVARCPKGRERERKKTASGGKMASCSHLIHVFLLLSVSAAWM